MPTLHWLTRDEDVGAASRALSSPLNRGEVERGVTAVPQCRPTLNPLPT